MTQFGPGAPVRPTGPREELAMPLPIDRGGGIHSIQAARPEVADRLRRLFSKVDLEQSLGDTANWNRSDFQTHPDQPFHDFVMKGIGLLVLSELRVLIDEAVKSDCPAVKTVGAVIKREIEAAEKTPPIPYSTGCGTDEVSPDGLSSTQIEQVVKLACTFAAFKLYATGDHYPAQKAIFALKVSISAGGSIENSGGYLLKDALENCSALVSYSQANNRLLKNSDKVDQLRRALGGSVDDIVRAIATAPSEARSDE